MHGISLLILIRMAGIRSRANGWFTFARKLTFKGTSPTNHFTRIQRTKECLTTMSLTVQCEPKNRTILKSV